MLKHSSIFQISRKNLGRKNLGRKNLGRKNLGRKNLGRKNLFFFLKHLIKIIFIKLMYLRKL
ncbi:MAG TPA: hypothetical protein EYM48_07425 [Campylobacterales bacterium]|nr:hypothetical protein [Campylobacterales bacterium]